MESEVRVKGAIEAMKDEKPKTMTSIWIRHPMTKPAWCAADRSRYSSSRWSRAVAYIFGGGHVGLNLYKVAMLAGF